MELNKGSGFSVEDCSAAKQVSAPAVQLTEWDLMNNTAETAADVIEDKEED